MEYKQCIHYEICDICTKCGKFKDKRELFDLHCKVGDTVWVINTEFDKPDGKCSKCEYYHEGSSIFRDNNDCMFDEIPVDCYFIDTEELTEHDILSNILFSFDNFYFSENDAKAALQKIITKG